MITRRIPTSKRKTRPARKENILTRMFLKKKLPKEQKVAKCITNIMVNANAAPMSEPSSRPQSRKNDLRRKSKSRKGSTPSMKSTSLWKRK